MHLCQCRSVIPARAAGACIRQRGPPPAIADWPRVARGSQPVQRSVVTYITQTSGDRRAWQKNLAPGTSNAPSDISTAQVPAAPPDPQQMPKCIPTRPRALPAPPTVRISSCQRCCARHGVQLTARSRAVPNIPPLPCRGVHCLSRRESGDWPAAEPRHTAASTSASHAWARTHTCGKKLLS